MKSFKFNYKNIFTLGLMVLGLSFSACAASSNKVSETAAKKFVEQHPFVNKVWRITYQITAGNVELEPNNNLDKNTNNYKFINSTYDCKAQTLKEKSNKDNSPAFAHNNTCTSIGSEYLSYNDIKNFLEKITIKGSKAKYYINKHSYTTYELVSSGGIHPSGSQIIANSMKF